MSWPIVELGVLATEGPTNGYSPRGGDDATGSWSFKLSATTSGHFLINEDTKKRLYETIPEDSKYWLRPGDLLVQRSNTTQYVGTAAIYEGPAKSFIYPDTMMRLRFGDKSLARWVWRYLNGPVGRQYCRSVAGGAAASMSKISGAKLKEFKLPLPPRPEQKRIAAVLDKADEIRRKRAEAIKLIEELLRSAFLEMFGDPVTNPKQWEVTTFGALCDRYGGELQTGPFGSQLHAADYSEEGVPVTMPRDLIGGRISTEQIARVSPKHVGHLARHKLVPGDLVFSRRGDVARFAIAEPENAGWLCGTGCLRIRPGRAPLESSFLWTELRHPSVRTWLEGEAKGTTMLNLNTQILSRLPVRVPPIDIQKKYARLVDMLRTPRWERMGNAELEQLSSSLTQRAFRGEL